MNEKRIEVITQDWLLWPAPRTIVLCQACYDKGLVEDYASQEVPAKYLPLKCEMHEGPNP